MKKKVILLELLISLMGISITGCSDVLFDEEILEESSTAIEETNAAVESINEENSKNEVPESEEVVSEIYSEEAIKGNTESELLSSEAINSEVAVDEVEASEIEATIDIQQVSEPIREYANQLQFDTVDINGNRVCSEDFKGAKIVMLNFWEPWCGSCVNEMPALEELYNKYKDNGFVIVGAFSTQGEDSSVKDIIQYYGITYPIVRVDNNMNKYTTEYVPTTIILDSNGNVLTDEPYIGGKSYKEWNKIIGGYFHKRR